MDDVSIRDLRNHGGDVVGRAAAGERLVITRDGRPVAELRPLRRPGASSRILVDRWSRLPPIDAEKLRRDVEAVLDSTV